MTIFSKKPESMISYNSGNIFRCNADIYVNPVNCVGVMGAGLALSFKNKFPDMFFDYQLKCLKKQLTIGNPYVWSNGKISIVNFPTKNHWKNPSSYSYIEKGLIWLKSYLIDKEGKTIAIPALGCGYGGLEWTEVKTMLIHHLTDVKTNVIIFPPH